MENKNEGNIRKRKKNNNPVESYIMKKKVRNDFEKMYRPELKKKYIYKQLAEKYLISEVYVMKIIKEWV